MGILKPKFKTGEEAGFVIYPGYKWHLKVAGTFVGAGRWVFPLIRYYFGEARLVGNERNVQEVRHMAESKLYDLTDPAGLEAFEDYGEIGRTTT